MAESSFGERLSHARRKKGLSVSQVADALRIRPSIIEALETATFEHMPLKGYARNMISSYARYLGLNPAQITEMFLREYHVFETHEARRSRPVVGSIPQTGTLRRIEHDPEKTGELTRVGSSDTVSSSSIPQRRTVHLSQRNTSAKTFWGDEAEPRRSIREAPVRETKRIQQKVQSKELRRSTPVDNRGYYTKGSRSSGILGTVASFFSGIVQPLLQRPILLVVLLVVVLIALLVALASFAGSCSRRDVDVLTVPQVSESSEGISEKEVGANMEEITQQMEENARYGPFELKIEVSEGATWLVVEVDGQEQYSGIADPGFVKVYTVTADTKIQVGAPGYVRLYRNEKPVELTLEDGLGVAELKVEQKPVASNANSAATPNANTNNSNTAANAASNTTGTGATNNASATGNSG